MLYLNPIITTMTRENFPTDSDNKQNAIKYFTKSVDLMSKSQPILYRWNWCATRLCLAQAYEKTNQKDKAIQICNETLKVYPNFKYMKNTYLPSLKK